MKRIYILIIFAALASCDILDQEPESLILTEKAITDRQSAESAVTGLYHTLQDGDMYGGRFIMATEMISGNGIASAFQAFWQELATGRVPRANFHVEVNWVAHYNTINAANKVIEEVPSIAELSDDEKESLTGVAYFMRGLAHFDLLRQYGEFFDQDSEYGIPLKLTVTQEGESNEIARNTVAATYQQIEEDLTRAINQLGNGSRYEVTQPAAQALLARVHLYQNDFVAAEALATEVINSGIYELTDDYNAIYDEEGAESIFEVNFIQLEDGNSWATEMYVSPPEVSVSQDLIDFMSARGESERNLLYDVTGSGLNRCIKYGSGNQEDGGNTIVFRLSELYLIRAEARGRLGSPNDALADINAVRARAEMPNITNIASEDELLEILLDERRVEFAFEGHYWFDMVRYDLLSARRGLEEFRKVLPIPFREVNISDGTLVQNPGYN
ncbi:RagB/SusD family nutrient uptake outer membrane protein [Fulvivirga sp. RKSG066]|uniref:RagB/SusD family nutrient uptake outer membrane protein n=1 Tax=Fulvivirga aurantia TaxID=2529383 RepID=UPI0012BC01A7|nr:RagB/SusD family nutrient uptake outer membrane protein [Fulvivirga aurantia]MTI20867.1 RagB/SusD family nutrient uptake outer membrane protein [Fulvivirga aurantia]